MLRNPFKTVAYLIAATAVSSFAMNSVYAQTPPTDPAVSTETATSTGTESEAETPATAEAAPQAPVPTVAQQNICRGIAGCIGMREQIIAATQTEASRNGSFDSFAQLPDHWDLDRGSSNAGELVIEPRDAFRVSNTGAGTYRVQLVRPQALYGEARGTRFFRGITVFLGDLATTSGSAQAQCQSSVTFMTNALATVNLNNYPNPADLIRISTLSISGQTQTFTLRAASHLVRLVRIDSPAVVFERMPGQEDTVMDVSVVLPDLPNIASAHLTPCVRNPIMTAQPAATPTPQAPVAASPAADEVNLHHSSNSAVATFMPRDGLRANASALAGFNSHWIPAQAGFVMANNRVVARVSAGLIVPLQIRINGEVQVHNFHLWKHAVGPGRFELILAPTARGFLLSGNASSGETPLARISLSPEIIAALGFGSPGDDMQFDVRISMGTPLTYAHSATAHMFTVGLNAHVGAMLRGRLRSFGNNSAIDLYGGLEVGSTVHAGAIDGGAVDSVRFAAGADFYDERTVPTEREIRRGDRTERVTVPVRQRRHNWGLNLGVESNTVPVPDGREHTPSGMVGVGASLILDRTWVDDRGAPVPDNVPAATAH